MALGISLTGCAQGYSIALLEPPSNPSQYQADLDRCTRDVAAYKAPGLDAPTVGYGALSGAARNAAGGAVGGPLVPALGALGGASDAISSGLDFMGAASAKVMLHCVKDLTSRDGAALVADPN